jgi:hypothetical protein
VNLKVSLERDYRGRELRLRLVEAIAKVTTTENATKTSAV